MVSYYRYSRWDGTQRVFDLDEEQVMEDLAEELLAHGNVARALRQLFQRGLEGPTPGDRLPGLRDLMERLHQRRQEQLERYNLDSVMGEIRQRLRDIVDTERRGIDRRLEEARQEAAQSRGGEEKERQKLLELLRQRADRNRQRLDSLPPTPAGQIQGLSEYDFMDPEAQGKFQELMGLLKQRMLQNFFQDLKQSFQNITPREMQRLRDMLRQLNRMLQERMQGREPDFQGFMQRYGDMFGPNPPQSLDELLEQLAQRIAQAQSLLNSLSSQQRQELMDLMDQMLDPETAQGLAQLAAAMAQLMPIDEMAGEYPFMGTEDLTWDQAMEVMGRLQDMDRLEQELREVLWRGNIEGVDPEKLGEVLGEEARRQFEQLQRIARMLEEAGYIRRRGERMELTPRGIRRIAQRALRDIFARLKRDRLGQHRVHQRGIGGETAGDTKPYEFGDPFDVHLQQTVMNGILRNGPGTPVRLRPEDFDIYRTEHQVQAATVLLLDQSRSMGLFGSFYAAKKVALALYALIQSQFPRDQFYIVGFSDYAVELKGEELPEVSWNAWVSGTNMHHAFMLSRKLLSRAKGGTRQILVITDGEPTAHLEGDRSLFSYPPSHRTVEETLKEVKRCTQADITINTFMLETNSYLVDFVDRMTRINRGRAFYTTPEKLGEYVLVDYVTNRRKRTRP